MTTMTPEEVETAIVKLEEIAKAAEADRHEFILTQPILQAFDLFSKIYSIQALSKQATDAQLDRALDAVMAITMYQIDALVQKAKNVVN